MHRHTYAQGERFKELAHKMVEKLASPKCAGRAGRLGTQGKI